MKSVLAVLNENQRPVALLGAVSGWAGFDLLRAAQFTAAALACLVSLCALILTGPQAVRKVVGWYRHWRA